MRLYDAACWGCTGPGLATRTCGPSPVQRGLRVLVVSLAVALSADIAVVAAPVPAGTKDPPIRQDSLGPADLGRLAAQAPPRLASLYRDLASPYDELTLPGGKRVRLPLLGKGWPGKAPGKDVSRTPYEEIALRKVAQLLTAKEPAALERAGAAEAILVAVLRFHLAFRQRPVGQANPWARLEARLSRKLLEVRAQRLALRASQARQDDDWQHALAEGEALVQRYPDEAKAAAAAAGVFLRFAQQQRQAGHLAAARAALDTAECRQRDLAGAAELRQALREQAETLRQQALGLEDRAAALAGLRQALQVCPQLPGLREELLKRQGAFTVLNVGVPTLPEQLSPATAWTDPEKAAVELLFERLVREDYDGARGERYAPELAALPEVLSGGRRFRLARNACWSDGRPVTALDVRNTAQLLARPGLPWRGPAWTDLLKVPEAADLLHIDVRFRHGTLDPLAPLSFHILPQDYKGKTLVRADAADFAAQPVGSGPFRYAGLKKGDGPPYSLFLANPYYQARQWQCAPFRLQPIKAQGRPLIREVRFFAPRDPVLAFRRPDHPLQLLLDLPTEQLDYVQRAGVGEIRTLEPRRVYFLAINHRVGRLARSPALRRALAHGLNREAILNGCFRGGQPCNRVPAVLGAAAAVATAPLRVPHPEFHRALNGPFPPRSWACAPPSRVPPDLFDLQRAQALLAQAKEKDSLGPVELTLKYPDDDPRVGLACREIARQLAALGDSVKCPLHLKLVPLPPRRLRAALAQRDYELAYHHHDYDSEAYWLWPLFDTHPEALAPGGSNYLGYRNDGDLASMLQEAMSRADFPQVRSIVHNLHAHLLERMPLVPLWQLDRHIVVHADLVSTPVDPLVIFANPAEWHLKTP
jgi:peptide/nickel transport system substrate-binding protein